MNKKKSNKWHWVLIITVLVLLYLNLKQCNSVNDKDLRMDNILKESALKINESNQAALIAIAQGEEHRKKAEEYRRRIIDRLFKERRK